MTRSTRDRTALLATRWPTGVAAGNQAGGSGRRGEERMGFHFSISKIQFNPIKFRRAALAVEAGEPGRSRGHAGLAGEIPTSYGTTAIRPPHAHML